MDYIFYSIEWLPNDSEFNCWNQYALTSRKWLMRFYKWECTKMHGKDAKIRVREL